MEYFWIDLAQYTFEGVLKGLLYAIVAIAFIVVYRSGRILNLAQGEILIFMAYVMWTFFTLVAFPFWIKISERSFRICFLLTL